MVSRTEALGFIVESAIRGLANSERHVVAAAVASATRTASEVLAGWDAPSPVEVETAERIKDIRPVVRARVLAGSQGERANLNGKSRKFRNHAEHLQFGAGPGTWRTVAKPYIHTVEGRTPQIHGATFVEASQITTEEKLVEAEALKAEAPNAEAATATEDYEVVKVVPSTSECFELGTKTKVEEDARPQAEQSAICHTKYGLHKDEEEPVEALTFNFSTGKMELWPTRRQQGEQG